jgi:hypothetical protein
MSIRKHAVLNLSVFALILLLASDAAASDTNTTEFSVILDKPDQEYVIDVGGTLDP